MSCAQILDGRIMAEKLRLKLRNEIVTGQLSPSLAVILVGDDPASQLYVKLKEKACHEVGVKFHKYLLPAGVSKEEIFKCIDWLNKDKEIDAILVQLPLPRQLDENEVIKKINPKKDADGFHPDNIDNNDIIPAPANAIGKLILASDNFRSNCQALVIANHQVIFKPLARILAKYHITTEYLSPRATDKIKQQAPAADILITAVGKPEFISDNLVKKNAIVIDVGTTKVDGKVKGDVDFDKVKAIAGAITPVPGGVGPMTIACLLENVVALHKNRN